MSRLERDEDVPPPVQGEQPPSVLATPVPSPEARTEKAQRPPAVTEFSGHPVHVTAFAPEARKDLRETFEEVLRGTGSPHKQIVHHLPGPRRSVAQDGARDGPA